MWLKFHNQKLGGKMGYPMSPAPKKRGATPFWKRQRNWQICTKWTL